MPRCVLLAIIGLVLGCGRASRPSSAPPLTNASDGIAGVVAHTESAERHVRSAIPHTDPTGKAHLSAASDEHKEVLTDASETKGALLAAQRQIDSLNNDLAKQNSAYQKLESRWYVAWGRWIERALWIIGISWLVFGVASVVLGMGNPLGWGAKLGKEVVRLAPAMNVFAWLRDWINRRRSAAAGG